MVAKNFDELKSKLYTLKKNLEDSHSATLELNHYMLNENKTEEQMLRYLAVQSAKSKSSPFYTATICKALLHRNDEPKKHIKELNKEIAKAPRITSGELETVINTVEIIENNFTFDNVSGSEVFACFEVLNNLCSIYYDNLSDSKAMDILSSASSAINGMEEVSCIYKKALLHNKPVEIEDVIRTLEKNHIYSVDILDCINHKKVNFLNNFITMVDNIYLEIHARFVSAFCKKAAIESDLELEFFMKDCETTKLSESLSEDIKKVCVCPCHKK